MDNMEGFRYTYSAKEQEEIKNIRKKYAAPAEEVDKMTQLRRLDQQVNAKAAAPAITLGVIGTLMMGLGMSLIMTDISKAMGMALAMLIGICVGVAGILLVCLAYPVYNRTLRKTREKVAPEILRLTDELLK